MAFNWYETQPGDSDIVSQHPANERLHRSTAKNAFTTEHSNDNGRHTIDSGTDAQRDALNGTWVEGNLWVSGQDSRIRLQRAASVTGGVPGVWQNVSTEFVAGTVVLFRQASAPIGWVQQTDLNDRVLRIVNSTGGGTGGAWGITGLSTESADHAHLTNTNTGTESAGHTHSVSGSTSGSVGGGQGTSPTGGPSTPFYDHTHTYSTTSGDISNTHYHGIFSWSGGVSVNHTHTGDGTWRPAYVNIISAVKS